MEAQEIINQISALSYLGIFSASFLAKFFAVVPEEAVILVLGYLAGSPRIDLYLLFPIVLVGTLGSDIVIYFLAKSGNKVVNGFYNKIFAGKLESKREWVSKNINKVVFFSRFLMQLRFLGPFFAGSLQMPFRKFMAINFLASIIYVPLYLFLGYYFRSRIEAILSGIGVARNIFITAVVLILLWLLLRHFHKIFIKYKIRNNKIDMLE